MLLRGLYRQLNLMFVMMAVKNEIASINNALVIWA